MSKTQTTSEMQLVAIDKLIPYANNARTHSTEQINKLRSSLREFGFVNPVIIDRDYSVIAGHGRIAAAKEEGIREVPCVFVDHLTEAQKKAYILADNRMALDAGWDEDMLRVELEALQGYDFDLSLTGFDEKELSALFDADQKTHEDNFDVEAELQKPCFSKPGDIWHLGRHTVICGDSTLPETFEQLLGDVKVNLVCTDAPYFVALKNKSGTIANDDLDDQQAYEFLMKCFSNFKNAMARDASIYEFYATMKTRVFYDAFEDAGFKVGAGLIWKKPRAPFMRTDWKFNMEPIIWGWRKDGKHIWYGDQKQTSVFEFDSIRDSEKEGYGHPSSKPVPLIAYLIKQCTQTNGLVLDGFLGSASTLIACEETGRVCYGVELEAKFVDVSVMRYRQYVTDQHFPENEKAEIYVIRDGKKMMLDEVNPVDDQKE
jgi:DNA modification methylase